MAARYSGATPLRTLARSSAWRCAIQKSVPSRMRLSLVKIGRYSNHCLAFSAGRSIASMMAGWLCAAFSNLRNCRFLNDEVSAMCAMKSLTSARLTSIADAGSQAAHTTIAISSRYLKPDGRRTPLGSDQLAMRVQRHQYAEARQQGDHRRADIADHRQRHADDRQNATHHAGVDEDVDEETERDGAARQARKGVLALHREVQGAPDDDAVQDQQHQARQQTEFLANDREYEVGGAFRQEFELSLTAHHVALAEHPAGADGDLRLDDVVSGAERIVFGIQERENALALVVVDEMPGCNGGGAEQRYRYQYDAQLHSGQQHHDEAGGRDQQRSAEVGLLGDHRGRNGDQHPHHQEILES